MDGSEGLKLHIVGMTKQGIDQMIRDFPYQSFGGSGAPYRVHYIGNALIDPEAYGAWEECDAENYPLM